MERTGIKNMGRAKGKPASIVQKRATKKHIFKKAEATATERGGGRMYLF